MLSPFHFKPKRLRSNLEDHPISDSEGSDDGNQPESVVESAATDVSKPSIRVTATKHSTTTNEPIFVEYYLTKVDGLSDKYAFQTIGLHDILSEQVGDLTASAQFNYLFEVDWLMSHYPPRFRNRPLLIVQGEQGHGSAEMRSEVSRYSNITLFNAQLSMPFGTHHSKMMLLAYADGSIRVVIHTANMIEQDWRLKTQGVWLSPLFPPVLTPSESADQTSFDSPTHFKADLLLYLAAYGSRNRSFSEWIERVRSADMREAHVYLIGSVPGRHEGARRDFFGHTKLRHVLRTSATHAFDSRIVAQFSSIGSLGPAPDRWLLGEFFDSLFAAASADRLPPTCTCPRDEAKRNVNCEFCCIAMRNRHEAVNTQMRKRVDRQATLSCVFPSVQDVRNSLEGYAAGGSLPYSASVAAKQQWLRNFACRWRADTRGRTRCCPHIKTFMVTMGPRAERCAWMLLTSANLSKAAWGSLERNGSQLAIRSYEIGVLFVPRAFQPDATHFIFAPSGSPSPSSSLAHHNEDAPRIVAPFDLPPIKYGTDDQMWIWDVPYTDKADMHGRFWSP